MKKRTICWILTAVWLLTGCGGPVNGGALVLPDPGNVAWVTITDGKTEVVSRDAALIARLLKTLEKAASTGEASVRDEPAGGWSVRLDFGFRSGGESRLFLCQKDGGLFLEQPFQGVWRTDGALLELLKEAGGWG